MRREIPHLVQPACCLAACLLLLAGCGVQSGSSASTATYSNWQIQTGSSITPPPEGALYLYGALRIQGSQVTGTLNSRMGCVPPLGTFTGTYDPSTGALAINSGYVQAALTVPNGTGSLATGTLAGGGYLCQTVMGPAPAVGVEIASLTGSYSGTATEEGSTLPGPITPGSVGLSLTQSGIPDASAAFPLTGTFSFTSPSCSFSTPVTGSISGVGLKLISNQVTIFAYTNPTASQINASAIAISPAPCGSGSSQTLYTGTLTL